MVNRAYIHDGSNWVQLQTGGFRNAIINGSFNIWQRGASFTTPTGGTYTADRWRGGGSGATAGTFTLARTALAVTDLPLTEAGLTYFMKLTQTVAPTATHNIEQRIENVRTFAGKTVTLSFYARLNSGTFPLSFTVVQALGTGGSGTPTSVTPTIKNSSGTTVTTATSSWERYTATFTIPSLSGMTIGTDDYVSFSLNLPASGTWNMDFAGIQLEEGSIVTPFENLPIALETALCQRYYYVIAESGKDFNYPVTRESTTQAQFMIITPVSLRIKTPILEKPATTAGRFVYRDTAFTVATSAVTSANLSITNATFSNNGFMLVGVGSTAVAGTYVYAEFDTLGAGAGNLALNAEL